MNRKRDASPSKILPFSATMAVLMLAAAVAALILRPPVTDIVEIAVRTDTVRVTDTVRTTDTVRVVVRVPAKAEAASPQQGIDPEGQFE